MQENELNKTKMVIFGTGGVAKYLLDNINCEKVEIVAFINSNAEITKYKNYQVITEEKILELQYDYIVIACGSFFEVKNNLIKNYNIPPHKIIGFISDEQEVIAHLTDSVNKEYDNLFGISILKKYCNEKLNKRIQIASMWFNNNIEVNKDFVREKTLDLLIKEIKRKNIAGNIAELGVFKGKFSAQINRLLCDTGKKLYLFDTFEGFNKKDSNENKMIGVSFQNTSISEVLDKMIYPEECIIKKGYFPTTFDIEDDFCLVSLDADLYEPMLAGLEKFYPKLSKGGYILVHDYYNEIYPGTQKAVQEYCEKNRISFVPIPDFNGTIVITK